MKLAKGAFLGWHIIEQDDGYLRHEKLYTGNPIHIANPEDSPKRWSSKCKLNSDPKGYGPYRKYTRYLFSFGVHAPTFLLVYADSCEDALEIAAEWLVDNEMWGHITPHDQQLEHLGCDCKDTFECDAHTYTESGWLDSYEWHVDEPVSNQELRDIHKG